MLAAALAIGLLLFGCSSDKPITSIHPDGLSLPDPSQTRTVSNNDDEAPAPYHEQFDFRFSNWGDSEETVASNEPGGFELVHVDGGKSTKLSSGYATAVLTCPDAIEDTVEVAYELRGGVLDAGYYWFDQRACRSAAWMSSGPSFPGATAPARQCTAIRRGLWNAPR